MSTETPNELTKVLHEMYQLQDVVLAYYNCTDVNAGFSQLESYLQEQKTVESRPSFTSFMCLISEISNNIFRSSSFLEKTLKIVRKCKSYFGQYYEALDCFNIFKNNKLLLLLLFQEQILTPNDQMNLIIQSFPYKERYYPEYFYLEFQHLNNEETNQKILKNISISTKSLPPDFQKKRLVGENDHSLCSYIRNDDLEQFIDFINANNYKLNTEIDQSIYETHPFLMNPTIIEYALFFGASQIVNYLVLQDISLTKQSWNYVVHSSNAELIHLLEDKLITPYSNDYSDCLKESIKCHNIEISNYIQNNKIEQDTDVTHKISIMQAIESHNYHMIPDNYDLLTGSSEYFVLLSKHHYYKLISTLLTMKVGLGILCSCQTVEIGNENLSSLHCAVENHDIDMVTTLMDTETYNAYGKSKLIEVVPMESGIRKTNCTTALFTAVKHRYYDIVDLLLKNQNRNVNEESEISIHVEEYAMTKDEKQTIYPMHAAIENHDDRMLEMLLSVDEIDINIPMTINASISKPYYFEQNTTEKKTPLQLAIECNNLNAIRLILESRHALAINKYSSFKLIKKLDGFDYDEDNQGNEEEEFPEDNERDKFQKIKMTALHMAIEKGNLEMVRLLLTNPKIDINARKIFKLKKQLLNIKYQKTPLQIAIEKKYVDIVKLLLEQASISINERTPYAFDRTPSIRMEYDENDAHEVQVGTSRHDNCLRTPLHIAVQTGCIEIIQLLLQNKFINITIPDGNNQLAIDYTDKPDIKALFS